jgi:uncharacterized protein YifE (UPF0438 family)
MQRPREHTTLLCRHDFVAHPSGDFTGQERALLERYGRWLEALALGAIEPITEEQRRFVQVARGECPPLTSFEAAWTKECRARAAAGEPQRIGPLEAAGCLSRLAEAKTAAEALHAEHTAERNAILEQVRSQLEAVDQFYRELLHKADEEVAQRENEVRQVVLQLGESAQQGSVQAVYCRGRVTWDAQGLNRYIEDHPELAGFRRVGAPSIRICYRDPRSGPSE